MKTVKELAKSKGIRLTENQESLLMRFYDEGSIDEEYEDGRTLASLYKRGLIYWLRYANCVMYSLTDKGLELFK
jgi:DNA-binding MarR family transcriptional regulator